MATNRVSNQIYITSAPAGADATAVATITSVYKVLLTATGANAVVNMQDNNQKGAQNVINLRNSTSGTTEEFDFTSVGGLKFPNGLIVDTVTNAIVTLITSSKAVE